jgi:hypothetical protein
MYFIGMRRIQFLCCCILLLTCVNQDTGDCSTLARPERGVELVYPRGGESFTLGQYIIVSWKADQRMSGAVELSVSQNGSSGPWRSIFADDIPVPGDSGVVCMDTLWIPGNEFNSVGYAASGTVLLRISDAANSGLYDESGMITISR